jgi:hypothetical protein
MLERSGAKCEGKNLHFASLIARSLKSCESSSSSKFIPSEWQEEKIDFKFDIKMMMTTMRERVEKWESERAHRVMARQLIARVQLQNSRRNPRGN